MKKYFTLLLLTLLPATISLAGSDVTLPVGHKELKAYPNEILIPLNGKNGMRHEIYYTLTCHISNPTQAPVIITYGFSPQRICFSPNCGSATLNAKPINNGVLHLEPGDNTFMHSELMTDSYHGNTNLMLKNYDNDSSIFVEGCKATIE